METLIHRIVITYVAALDCRESVGCRLNAADVNRELSEYITHMRCLADRLYFHADYFDEDSGKMLRFFVYRARRLRMMQFWEIRGVCLADDYDEDFAEAGCLRAWANSPIDDLPEELDWAISDRTNRIMRKTEQTEDEDIFAEVLDGFEIERNKATAAGLLFLQNAGGKRRGRGGDKGNP